MMAILIAFILAFLNTWRELENHRKELLSLRDQRGVLADIEGQAQFELFRVGDTNYGVHATNFTGAYLIIVSRFKEIELELTWYNGETDTRRHGSFPLTKNNFGLFLSTCYSENSDKPAYRMLRLHNLGESTVGGDFEIPFRERLVIPNIFTSTGEIDGRVIFAFQTYSQAKDSGGRLTNISCDVTKIEQQARDEGFGVVYGKLIDYRHNK